MMSQPLLFGAGLGDELVVDILRRDFGGELRQLIGVEDHHRIAATP